MAKVTRQLDLFHSPSLDTTHEIKRQIRLALANSTLSRDQVVDRMNEIAVREGMRHTTSKASLDNWVKDSDPERLPALPWVTILCEVLETVAPIAALAGPLGGRVIGPEEAGLLTWAQAELEKRRATKKARLALEGLEVS